MSLRVMAFAAMDPRTNWLEDALGHARHLRRRSATH